MGKKLVIAEKPMLAKAILDAIPGTAKSIKAGERVFYTEKGDYLVVALAGHVLQLKEPEDYDPKYKKWTLEDLPIFFPDWAAVPAQGKGNIVKCVKSLLPQADSVIHAGDVDDEGQLIVDELLRYCGYRGKVQRLYTSDTSTAALKKRLGMLEDNAKWEPLGVSAYARSVTDKTFGINFSRLYTKLNGTLLTVGRVQTPAMGLVVARDEAIENHVARKYYALEVQAEIDGRQPYIPAEFIPTKGNPLLGEEDKVWERKGLEKVLAECREKSFPAKVSKKEETEAPPLPFNLNKLNLYCSSRWGYDPQQVMEITQSLREKYRAITYNRSDSQYLTTEQFREAPGTVSRALANLGMQIPEIDTSRKSRCFDDSKVSAHTAIIPTNEKVNVGAMTRAEQNVYKAICGHYLIQFMPGCKKRKTNLRIDCPQGTFSATSVEVIDKGFKAVIRAGSEDKAPGALSGFAAGDYRACIMDGSVTEHETTPPRRYTNGSNIWYDTAWYVHAPARYLDLEAEYTLYPCEWCEQYHGFAMGTDHWHITGYETKVNQDAEKGDVLTVATVENLLGETVQNYKLRFVSGTLRVHPKLRFQLKATVPMYVCMYAYNGDGEVVEPTEYGITNYSNGSIRVTDINVDSTGGGFLITDKAPLDLLRGEMSMNMFGTQLVPGANTPANPERWIAAADASGGVDGVFLHLPLECYIASGNVNDETVCTPVAKVQYTIAEYGKTVPEVDDAELPEYIHGEPVTPSTTG